MTIPTQGEQTYSISALESFLNVTGTSELSKFRNEAAFVSKQVDLLPREYNGDCVFELPPIKTWGLRGAGLSGMDRENDCYSWTRLVTTSGNILKKKLFQVQKAVCMGVLECRNVTCAYLKENGMKNTTGWVGRGRNDSVYMAGEQVPTGGLVCGVCNCPPFCLVKCPA